MKKVLFAEIAEQIVPIFFFTTLAVLAVNIEFNN